MDSDDSSSRSDIETKYDIDYNPKYFLRCHSKQKKDAADVQAQVWQCSFQPSLSGGTSNVVATCGGKSVCFIDVGTGQIKKKYYSANPRENFFALSWTTINGHNILAAGGAIQCINFIAYDAGFCCHEERFEKNVKYAITSLLFHPKESNILYASFSDGRILILNIGSPSAPEYKIDVEVMHKYQVTCEVFLLAYYRPKEYLFGTSDDGIYCWMGSPKKIAKGTIGNGTTLLQFLGRPLALTESPSLVDTAEVLENGLVASKCALHGAIYIWNVENVLEEGIMPEKKIIRITPLYQLKWSDTDNYFMYLGYNKECKLLACGDDKGAIWMYDISDIIDGTKKTVPKEMIEPNTVFEWPNLHDQYSSRKRKLNLDVYDIVINKVVMSNSGKHLVAVTNNNMVCIWVKKK